MKKWLTIVLLSLMSAISAQAQTTSVITGTIRDLAGNVVPTGQVTFDLRPSLDTTISGNSRFTPQTIVCTINQTQSFTSTGIVRAAGSVTTTFSNPTVANIFIPGDVITVANNSPNDLNGTFTATATGGVSGAWTVTWAQAGSGESGGGGYLSALRANPGPGSCTVTQNTALIPSGTYYQVGIWPSFARIAVFNFYALTNSVDLSLVTPTPGQTPAYSFVDLFTNQTINGNKTFTGTTIFSGPVIFGTIPVAGTILSGSLAIKGPNPWVDVLAFGALCDNSTDDSTALQNAGNFAIAQKSAMKLPPGQKCKYATTLTFTSPLTIIGAKDAGSSFSQLVYTGSSNGIVFNSGSSLFNIHLENFSLVATGTAAIGVQCVQCLQYFETNFGVFGLQTYPTTGWTVSRDLTGAVGVTIDNPTCVDTAGCFKLYNASDVNINVGNFFQNTVDYLMGGNSTGLFIHDSQNYEAQDYFILIDDTLTPTTTTLMSELRVENNVILFDGGAATYPHQKVMQVNNSSTNQMYIQSADFEGNRLSCPNIVCAGDYAFKFNISATTSVGTVISAVIEKNFINAFSAGGVTANNSKVTGVWLLNKNLQSDGLTPNTDTNGTGVFAVLNYPSGVLTFPQPIATVGITDTGTISEAAVTLASDTVHNTSRQYFNCNVPTTGAASIAWCSLQSVDKPITVTRVGLVANGQALTCSTSPEYGILTTTAFATLTNSTTFVDSGALSVNLAAGTYTVGIVNVDAGCGTQPTNVSIAIEYKMQ